MCISLESSAPSAAPLPASSRTNFPSRLLALSLQPQRMSPSANKDATASIEAKVRQKRSEHLFATMKLLALLILGCQLPRSSTYDVHGSVVICRQYFAFTCCIRCVCLLKLPVNYQCNSLISPVQSFLACIIISYLNRWQSLGQQEHRAST